MVILLSFFNNGAILNIKPVLEWSNTVLLGVTFKFNILLKYKLRERCYVYPNKKYHSCSL